MILMFIKYIFVELLSSGRQLTSQIVKCKSSINKPCLARPTIINLNPNELCYYQFMINLDNIRNALGDFSDRICVSIKQEM